MDSADLFERKAEESGEDLPSESSEEEDKEVADLIDDEEEAEHTTGESDSDGDRRRKRDMDTRLEEEDYDLIRENLGIDVPRPKYRRVKLINSDDDEEQDSEAEEDTGLEREGSDTFAKKRTGGDLFVASDDDEDGESLTAMEPEGSQSVGKDRRSYMDDDDEMNAFIVQDRGHRKDELDPLKIEAQEVFGLDYDPADFEHMSDTSEDYEDDDDEYSSEEGHDLDIKPPKVLKGKKKASIYDVYEPSELERGHYTEKDVEIRVTDMPERFQLRSIPVQKADDVELEEEATWIYHKAFCSLPVSQQPHYSMNVSSNAKPASSVAKIKETVNFFRNFSFEVPFIAIYRREYIEPELGVHDLWKIWSWDEKWVQLQQRKKNMKHLFKKMQDWQFRRMREEPDKALTEEDRVLQDFDIQRLETVESNEELSDVYAHFKLYYGKDLVAMQKAGITGDGESLAAETDTKKDPDHTKVRSIKQAKRKDFYAVCQEAGLSSLAAKFGLTPEQFGENLRDNYQRHETSQYHAEPEEAAQEYVQPSGYFSTVRAVLHGACHMVSMQLASEPIVRQVIRQVYQTRAVICVKPTKKGRKMVDESHPCWNCLYLRNKPVRELKGEEFLKLSQAENDGLLTIKVSVDIEPVSERRPTHGNEYTTFFEEVRMLYYRDEFSMLVEKWNAQRAQALAHTLMKVLYPQMEKELRTKLLLEAKEHVLQCCVQKFRTSLAVGGYQLSKERDVYAGEKEGIPRVMACAYSTDRNVPGFCCFLDGNGEVIDFIRVANILKRRNNTVDIERIQKEEEIKKVKDMIDKRKPDVIVVSAESREALSVVEDLKMCVLELEEEGGPCPTVELMDPSIARIYSKSARAKENFPSYPELLKLAVSLGRRMQEPLHEFTSLFLSHEDEIYSLRLHPLQDCLPRDEIRNVLEKELVNVVNQVGVDINFCIDHAHAEGLVPFLSGFGPRKAAVLLKMVRQEGGLQDRSQLVAEESSIRLGPNVFMNCAGFVKISNATFSITDANFAEILDTTRIHPETYEWARKMAVDALEYDETDDGFQSGAVEDILDAPEKLKDLDLDAFAEELERQGLGNKRTTLYDIRDEMFGPFKDRRHPFSPMSVEEKFCLLTGETPESLHEGKLVTCTVTGIVRRKPSRDILDRANPIKNQMTGYWQCPFCLQAHFTDLSLVWGHIDDGSCPGQGIGVRTRLENGLIGFILAKNLSDKPVDNPEERVQPGMTIHCRVLRVNLDKYSVDLSCRSSDLADKQGKFSIPKDIYYDHASEQAARNKEEESQKLPQQKYMKRVIVHPSFINASFSEVERCLQSMDQGDAVFRPSSKGHDHLTLSWKVTEEIVQHVDIKEQDKPNVFSIGKSLWIGEEGYEDLDEILARFVQPMAANARDLVSNKYYEEADGGDRSIIESKLKLKKESNPKLIPYILSASKQFPGKFILAYQPSTRAKFEFVTVVPNGFRYRGQVHSTVRTLIEWFKEHFREPVQVPYATQTPTSIHGTPIPVRLQQHGQTPYTPSQWTHHTPTPSPTPSLTPRYGHHQQPSAYYYHHQTHYTN